MIDNALSIGPGLLVGAAMFFLASWVRQCRGFPRLLAIALWLTFAAFDLLNSEQFAALNATDRAETQMLAAPDVVAAQRAYEDKLADKNRECGESRKLGPNCRRLRDVDVPAAQRRLDDAKAAAKSAAVGSSDLAIARLALRTVLPQLGSLLLMVARG